MFEVRDEEEAEKLGLFLDRKRAKDFHHSVVQLLFISTRVRRDIQTAVAFLTTRIKRPDEDDWGKVEASVQVSQRDQAFEANAECR